MKLEKLNLNDLLADLVETVNYEIPEGQQPIKLHATGDLGINGDRELLWRAFENLLRNALIHSGTEGGISIEAEEFEPKEDASKGQITSAFKKFSKSKKTNKTLLTNFGKAVAE